MMTRWQVTFYGLVVLLLMALMVAVPAAQAQGGPTYTLHWWTVDDGGTTSGEGGGYTLGGTSGQPDAAIWAGGGYTLRGGFWVGRAANGPVTLYLPVIIKDYWPAPDLIMTSLSAGGGGLSLTLKNEGNQSVTDAFWVDVYFNPNQPPGLNQPWDSLASAGAVWGVTAVIPAGGTLNLTTGGDYYFPQYSSSSFPVGVPVYAYVDSLNYATNYGNVRENNEGNNLFGPVMSTAGGGPAPISGDEANRAPDLAGLPER